MATPLQLLLGLTAAVGVAAPPLTYAWHRSVEFRNFRVADEGVLYRSGQLTPEGLERVLHEKGIRTLVTLRTSRVAGKPPPDTWEEGLCAAYGVRHVRIVPRLWSPDEKGEVPAERAVEEFLRVMDDPNNRPVLLHCFAGIHRTGTMCAVFRMEYQRWPAERALAEMRRCGFEEADAEEFIDGYLRGYRPRWKRASE